MAIGIDTERRSDERVHAVFHVDLNSESGVTRNVGVGGIFFEAEANCCLSNEICFVIEMEAFGTRTLVKCEGNILRREAIGQKIGVAVKLTEAVMEAAN